MTDLFKKKFKFIILICLIEIFSSWFPIPTQAYLAPEIYVTELKINEIKDYEIKGEFTTLNNEDYYFSDLNYQIELFRGTDFEKLEPIDLKVSKETFFIPPNEKIIKSFTFKYPKNIISGDYTLRVRIITEKGSELGWKDEIISLKGENRFLEIVPFSAKLLINEEDLPATIGMTVSSEEKVISVCKVKNPGDEITVIPKIKVFKRQINMPLVREYEDSPITFTKEETKEIKLEMPKIDIPESYLAEVKFYENQEQVSGTQYFRWIVEGEGGTILYVKADKDYYKAGEDIEITITSVGPADASDIGDGKIEITIYDRDGNVVAQTLKDVSLNPNIISSRIIIPNEKDLISPKIEAKIIKDENILDEHKIELPIFSEEAKQIEKELERQLKREKIKKYLLYSISVIILLIIGFLIYKFKICQLAERKK